MIGMMGGSCGPAACVLEYKVKDCERGGERGMAQKGSSHGVVGLSVLFHPLGFGGPIGFCVFG